MDKLRRWRRGFTLVELLVVVAIIAILVAILMPVLNGAREKARQTRCSANMLNITSALKQYKTDYGRYPFRPYYDATLGMYMGGVSALYPEFISDKSTLLCPNDTRATRLSGLPGNYSSYNGVIHKLYDSTAAGADQWRFEAQGGGVGNAGTLCEITYNYGGFSQWGWDESWWDATLTPPRWNELSPPGGAVPGFLAADGKKWRHYPRLSNRRAPDNTIAIRCRCHHAWYGPDETTSSPDISKWRDMIGRIAGGVGSTGYSQWTAVGASGAAQWTIQE